MLPLLLAFFLCSRLAAGETGFDVPNSWLTSVIDTYPPGLGEPLNVVVSLAAVEQETL